jgi:hypothetical protein
VVDRVVGERAAPGRVLQAADLGLHLASRLARPVVLEAGLPRLLDDLELEDPLHAVLDRVVPVLEAVVGGLRVLDRALEERDVGLRRGQQRRARGVASGLVGGPALRRAVGLGQLVDAVHRPPADPREHGGAVALVDDQLAPAVLERLLAGLRRAVARRPRRLERRGVAVGADGGDERVELLLVERLLTGLRERRGAVRVVVLAGERPDDGVVAGRALEPQERGARGRGLAAAAVLGRPGQALTLLHAHASSPSVARQARAA